MRMRVLAVGSAGGGLEACPGGVVVGDLELVSDWMYDSVID